MGKRPDHIKPPPYLSPDTPVPVPEPVTAAPPADERDATRYGDWELKGVAVDF